MEIEFIWIVGAVVMGLAIFSLIGTLIKCVLVLTFDDVANFIRYLVIVVGVVVPMILFQLTNINVMYSAVDNNNDMISFSDLEGWNLLLIPFVTILLTLVMEWAIKTTDTIHDF
jgi:hypothetical protein